jgi:hypothetical protein
MNATVETEVDGKNVVEESVKNSAKKKDVGPDVETSLSQQEKSADVAQNAGTSLKTQVQQDDVTVALTDDDSGFDIANEEEVHSGDTIPISPTHLEKDTAIITEIDTPEKEKDVVDLEDSDLNQPIAKTYKKGSIAKRLRSTTGKVVTPPTKASKTRMKSVAVGPKKRWSKVTPKVTIGSKSKKRKVVESSDSDFDDVEEDVPNISASVSKKSAGNKTSANVSVVPTDNISFHCPEYAQRWKYVFNRRLTLER